MRIIVGGLSIIFGSLYFNTTVNSFGAVGNILLHIFGLVLCILGVLVIAEIKNKKGGLHRRVLGIGIAMNIFGIAFILTTPSGGAKEFGLFLIVLGLFFALLDYLAD